MKIPHIKNQPFRLVLRAAAGALALLGFGNAQSEEVERPYYVYDGQRIELSVDRSTAVVKEAAPTPDGPAARPGAEPRAESPWVRIPLFPEEGDARDGVQPRVAPPAVSPTGAVAAASDEELVLVRAAVEGLAREEGVEFVSPVFQPEGGTQMTATPVILAGFAANLDAAATVAGMRREEIVGIEQIGASGVWKLATSLRDGFAVLELANWIAEQDGVEFAEVDFVMQVSPELRPNDPLYPQLWGHSNTGQSGGLAGFDMGAERAWDLTVGSSSVIVLVLDDGVQRNHPDLSVPFGRDFTGSGGDGGPVYDTSGYRDAHGTAVGGAVSARINNGVGTVGIAPGARLASAKVAVWGSQGASTQFQTSWVVAALDWGRSIGARISNNSWGGGSPSSAMENAFIQARSAGMVHFAASGNSNSSSVLYPARYASVVAVGAANRYGSRASFSSYGEGLEFLAPGEDIVTVDRSGSAGYASGDYAMVDGTSFASPYAAGVAALLLSREPGLTPAQVLDRMRQSCRDMHTGGYDTVTGHGLLDAYRTLVPGGAPEDDHGSTFSTATPVNFPSQTPGVIETGDNEDFFRFTLSQRTNARIASVSAMDPVGYLYGGDESLIASNDDAFQGDNIRDFAIERELAPGTYYVRVRSYGTGTGSYRLDLSGSAVTATAPRIRVEGASGQLVANGSSQASASNGTLFDTVRQHDASLDRTFVVRNAGDATLQLNGSPRVSIAGAGAAQFRVVASPAASISPGNGSSIRIEYAPAQQGRHTATVSIRSNDGQADPYQFAVEGNAEFPVLGRDDHGNDIWSATPVGRRAVVSGNLEVAGDEDFFRFQVSGRRQRARNGRRVWRAEQVRVFTTGDTDTYGYLMRGTRTVAADDDSGTGHNFSISRRTQRGTHYVRVRGYDPNATTGAYTLHIR